jgi:hypothetical protein
VIGADSEKIEHESEYGFAPCEDKPNFLCKRISCKTFDVDSKVFKQIKIMDICCNDFAAHFLSEDGTLFTMGKDTKKYGLLGLGVTYETSQPVINQSLIDFRI